MSFLLFSCVFRWFWRDLVECYVSVQVTYLLDSFFFRNFIATLVFMLERYIWRPFFRERFDLFFI